ncbi:MAG: hypothetical protein WAU91_07385 [Desulfatitalea sp.]
MTAAGKKSRFTPTVDIADDPATASGGVMNSKIFRWPATRTILWPTLILALWLAPALGADTVPAAKPLPQRILGIWQVTGVLSDAGSPYAHKFEFDDPRLMGGILFVSPQRIIAKADGETESCKNPTVTMQNITAGQLIKDTMGGRVEPPEHPTTRDFDLPFDQNEQLTVMWVKGFGCWDHLTDDGTWMLEMPDGRLAMRWRTSSIVLWSRAPANIKPPASFDCAKARTPVEKTICGSVELSLLDNYESEWYTQTISNLVSRAWGCRDKRYLDAIKPIKNEQKAWLKQRDACGADPQCLKSSMDTRIDAMTAIKLPNYSDASSMDVHMSTLGTDAAPAAKPLPEALIGVWRVTGVLIDADLHWVYDFVNNDPRLMGGVVLISPQRILAKAGGETVSCINPTMTAKNIAAGPLIKETLNGRPFEVTMNGRNVEPPKDPTPNDFGFPFEPNTPLTIMWVKDFDGYWQALTSKGTWLLEMPDGRLAMRWHYAAILLLSRAPAATRPADIKQTLASFDCAKAQTPVEKTICGSLALSLLDSYVSEWYEGFLGSLTEKLSYKEEPEPDYYRDMMKQIKKEQRAWRKQRDASGPEPQCLKDSMDARAKNLADADANQHLLTWSTARQKQLLKIPSGSSTWAPRAARPAAASWPRARPKQWPPRRAVIPVIF